MIKKLYSELKAPCPYRRQGAFIKECEHCNFFNDLEKDDEGNVTGVECLYEEIPVFTYHVTSFLSKDKVYRVKEYDGPGDHCEKCCFYKQLQNGKNACILSVGTKGSLGLLCWNDEIWEEVKNDGDDR